MLRWIGNNLGTILITLRSLPWWQPSSGAFTKAGAPGRAPAAAAAPTAPWRAPATAPTARRNDSDRRAAQRKRRLPCGSASHTRDRLSIQELDRQGKGSRAAGLFRRAAVPGGCGNSPACWAGARLVRRAVEGAWGSVSPKTLHPDNANSPGKPVPPGKMALFRTQDAALSSETHPKRKPPGTSVWENRAASIR